jgi:hypothetical protein
MTTTELNLETSRNSSRPGLAVENKNGLSGADEAVLSGAAIPFARRR